MGRALIRFARRRANWEAPELPLEELQSREIKARNGGPDLRPSVYELDDVDTQLIQAYAEHAHRIDPPPSALALDVACAVPGEVKVSPGDAPFRFTRGQHREVVLGDLCELLRFVRAELEGLLAWPERKVVLVQEPSASDVSAWQARGFVAFDHDAPDETILESLRNAGQ